MRGSRLFVFGRTNGCCVNDPSHEGADKAVAVKAVPAQWKDGGIGGEASVGKWNEQRYRSAAGRYGNRQVAHVITNNGTQAR